MFFFPQSLILRLLKEKKMWKELLPNFLSAWEKGWDLSVIDTTVFPVIVI